MPQAPAKRPITVDDLARFVLPFDPRISPDGTKVLFGRKHSGEKNAYVSNLWTVDVAGGEPRQFTNGGKDGNGRWSPDGSRIAFVSSREEGRPQVYVMPADGGEATPLTDFPEGTITACEWSPDGSLLAVVFREIEPEWTSEAKKDREEEGGSVPARVIDDLFYRYDGDGYFNSQRHGLYVVDAATGEHRLVFDRDTTGFFSFDWSPDSSELVVAANTHPNAIAEPHRAELYRVTTGGDVSPIPDLPEGEKAAPRWSPTGEWIAYAAWFGKEMWGVQNGHLVIARPDGSEVRDLSEHEDFCLTVATLTDTAEASFGACVEWLPNGERVLAQIGWHGEQHVASIGLGGDERFHFLTNGRRSVSLGNVSADGTKIALVEGNPTSPGEIVIGSLDAAGRALPTKTLTSFNGEVLGGLDLAEPEPHWIESPDGTRVQTWVMRPPASARRDERAACVIEVHGGPHTQYGEAFFHEFQLLAATGYVVVYSNPRGSKGYGEEHTIAIRGQWGRDDWTDVQAVTEFVSSLPDVDPERIGIMGGSYGGYMTNWAIAHSKAYKAAITDRCVSNFLSMAGSSDVPLIPGGYWAGAPWEEPEELWAQSPIAHFANVETPTLVIHSEGDLRCNVEQGEQVFAALKLRGIPTRFVRYPRETSHGLSRCGPMDLRQHRLREILRWWSEWL